MEGAQAADPARPASMGSSRQTRRCDAVVRLPCHNADDDDQQDQHPAAAKAAHHGFAVLRERVTPLMNGAMTQTKPSGFILGA